MKSEQPFAVHFLLLSCDVCPVANLEICTQTQLLATHSLCKDLKTMQSDQPDDGSIFYLTIS